MPHQTASSYDSESEDDPRIVLDHSCDFYVPGSNPAFTFKLHEFKPMVQDSNGNMIPFPGMIAVKPVPRPEAVAASSLAMGNGQHGVWTATKFLPPQDTCSPLDVFAPRRIKETFGEVERFLIRHRHVPAVATPRTMCIFIDGACPDNGNIEDGRVTRGGCGVVYKPTNEGTISFPLELQGPDGVEHAHTSNRAELRAAILALTFRKWWGSGFEKVVLVTDSEYVAKGATERLQGWASKNWRTANRQRVQNRDLWEKLSEVMGEYARSGCEIAFWAVPRAWNQLADQAAKEAASNESDRLIEFSGIEGVMV